MKTLASILLVSALLLVGIAGGCGLGVYGTVQDLLHNQYHTSSAQSQVFRWCTNGLPFLDQLPKLLDRKRFLVLLQNNMELRATGGFLGSYAVVTTAPTGLTDIHIQDIYVPDGQLVGHVDPPRSIEQAFGQGWWKLRDSNWDPDFRIAAEQVAWFFDQGGEPSDGVVAVNLSLIEPLLAVLGPVKATDYPETITAVNFYELAQNYAEENFFPGSTQKRDFLGAVGKSVINKALVASPITKLKIAKIVWRQLKNKQILMWFKDPDLQQIATGRDWTGDLGKPTSDYLYIVESNLGANKANCCVTRFVAQDINALLEKLTITWKNDSLFANPVKPVFWGGNYIDFVRVLVPKSAAVTAVNVGGKELKPASFAWQYGLQENIYQIEDKGDFQAIGFWAVVPAKESLTTVIDYKSAGGNSILVKRQPGLAGFDYQLTVNGKIIVAKKITADDNIGPWTK